MPSYVTCYKFSCCCLFHKRLPSPCALRVNIWSLPKTDRSLACSLAKVLIQIVGSCCMVNRSVVPNCDIIGVLPAVSDLQVVIVNDQSDKPFKQSLALFWSNIIDVLYVVTDSKDRLPACDRVRSDDRMDGLKDFTHIFGSAARF